VSMRYASSAQRAILREVFCRHRLFTGCTVYVDSRGRVRYTTLTPLVFSCNLRCPPSSSTAAARKWDGLPGAAEVSCTAAACRLHSCCITRAQRVPRHHASQVTGIPAASLCAGALRRGPHRADPAATEHHGHRPATSAAASKEGHQAQAEGKALRLVMKRYTRRLQVAPEVMQAQLQPWR